MALQRMATPCPKQRENKMPRKTTSKQAPDDGKPRRQHRLSGKKRRRLAGDNPFAAPHYGPTDSFQFMEEEMVNIYRALFGLVTCAALIPFILVVLAIDEIARRKRRRAYYEREKEKRIELANKKRMKLGEYVKPGDIAEGRDGRYYVYDREEFARRVALESERRRIRKHTTLNKCPTSAELKAQWARVKESHIEMLRFGSMLCDLEAYVDNLVMHNAEGEFIGRNPGIKGWLTEHCPEIRARYTTAMRYKAMAVRARQVIGMDEPHPLDTVLDGDLEEGAEQNETDVKILGYNTGNIDIKNTEQNRVNARSEEKRKEGDAGGAAKDIVGGMAKGIASGMAKDIASGMAKDIVGGMVKGIGGGSTAEESGIGSWRRKLREILADAAKRERNGKRKARCTKDNLHKEMADTGKIHRDDSKDNRDNADALSMPPPSAKAKSNNEKAADKMPVTQAALVMALEAMSEPLWALVKSVETETRPQTA